MRQIINWKIFFILLSLSLFSVVCILPYILTLQGELLKSLGQPVGIIILAQLIQSLILFSLAIFLGLILIKTTGFSLPLLNTLVKKANAKAVFKQIFSRSVLLGAAVGVTIYLTDALFTALGVGISTHQVVAPAWQTLLAAFYGGITEEILMRLFLMSLFIWIGMKLFKLSKPPRALIVVAIILAAVIFGLGHLPVTASLTALTPMVVSRAIVLNGLGGLVFGWLFWKKGLESAMIAHFTADVFLLTLLPRLMP